MAFQLAYGDERVSPPSLVTYFLLLLPLGLMPRNWVHSDSPLSQAEFERGWIRGTIKNPAQRRVRSCSAAAICW
jgi:hypothetical protein